jgi:hypothetical protein
MCKGITADILYDLPKVSFSFPLSPRRGERFRVKGDKKKLLANAATACKAARNPAATFALRDDIGSGFYRRYY